MLRLFYFSGTGNARNVARWIVDAFRVQHRDAEAFAIAETRVDAIVVGPEDEVGFASPTHGFNFPPVTLAFLFRFPSTRHRNRAFVINTRAGVRLFGLYVPGLSGLTQILAAIILLVKGYRVVGMQPIDLPSNWISLHPGLRQENVEALYDRCRAICQRFAARLLAGERSYRALWDLPLDLLIAPISFGYYLIGRFVFAKSFIANAACDACGVCVQQCPVHAIALVSGRPFWSRRCESCMKCMNQCPKRAIETAHGFIIGTLVLIDIAMVHVAIPHLTTVVPFLFGNDLLARALREVAQVILTLASLFVAYRVLHALRVLKPVDLLVTWTSFTHFAFWRRYRAPAKRQDNTARTSS